VKWSSQLHPLNPPHPEDFHDVEHLDQPVDQYLDHQHLPRPWRHSA